MAKNKIAVYSKGKQYDIQVYANQKVVMTTKVNPKGGKIFDLDANKRAMQDLSPHGYVLYMHFIQNVPGYIEALSLKIITATTPLSEKTYYKAVNELITKGYLVRTFHEDYNEFYIFYEIRQEACGETPSPSDK